MHAKECNPYTHPPARITSRPPPQRWVYVATLGSVLLAWLALTLGLASVFRLKSADASIAIFDLEVLPSSFLSPSGEVSSSHYFWIEVSLPGLLVVVLASLGVTYLITWAFVARWQSCHYLRVRQDGET